MATRCRRIPALRSSPVKGVRRLGLPAVGVAVMILTAVVVVRLAGGDGDRVEAGAPPSSVALDGGVAPEQPDAVLAPGEPPASLGPEVPPGPAPVPPPATLPAPGVVTIPLPDLGTGATTGPGQPTTTATMAPAFTEPGVWVVKSDGTSPILVARSATAGVAVGGTHVAFVEGSTVRAVRRNDLRAKVDLATGVSGHAAQGLPISGGKRGVAFLQGGRAVLVDPAAPGQPVAAFDAPGADAVAAEEDGDGRLIWADQAGLHLGSAEGAAPDDDVERGILQSGHGILAHVQGGRVVVRNGPKLAWGEVDRLRTGPAGMVAGSGGRVRFRTRAGEDRVLLEQASTPVVAATRILYVSAGRALASSSLSGTGATTVATAGAGRAISDLDLLDDTTLVVTVV
jgi:hypothetical protein